MISTVGLLHTAAVTIHVNFFARRVFSSLCHILRSGAEKLTVMSPFSACYLHTWEA